MKNSHVYLMTNKNNTVIYTGVSSQLEKRVYQHKTKFYKGFTAKYNCDQLVYFEEFNSIKEAIEREKQIKKYRRQKKVDLIEIDNPEWKDLSEGWVFNFN